ncbi:hypothetical protein [Thiolapillus sp.]|uniref:hypothetical protein n=2 Tax=Thiolapillus sp. TaxID=2017437 RepID=UPI0025F0884B|nr:hypothetical protein [Thiolapillus sp.]
MKTLSIWVSYLALILLIAGCSEVQNNKKETAWVKPVNEETCAKASIEHVEKEYGKDVSQGLGSACFLRTSTPSFAFYSPKKQSVQRIVIDPIHCTNEMPEEVKGVEGADALVAACAAARPAEDKKSTNMQW